MVTLAVYVTMNTVVYPMAAVVSFLLYGPPGLLTAWVMVLQQLGFLSVVVIKTMMMPEIERLVFDAVLSRENTHHVVLRGKLRRVSPIPFTVQVFQYTLLVPQSLKLPWIVLRALFLLLVGTIPLAGPLLIILLQSPKRGARGRARYHQLKNLTPKQIAADYRENTGPYTGFGAVALLLESVPILTIFFMFTNTIGAALWVVDIESVQVDVVDTPEARGHAALVAGAEF